MGVWTAGIDPPDELRELSGTSTPKKDAKGGGKPGGGTPGGGDEAPKPGGMTQVIAHLRTGDFDKVKDDDVKAVDEKKPEELVARAEYRWLKYVREVRIKDAGAKLDAYVRRECGSGITSTG